MHVRAVRAGLCLEQRAEGKRIDLAALEARPGIGMGIGGVDLAQEVARQAAAVLIAAEGLERAGENHPAEIPQDGLDFQSFNQWIFPVVTRLPNATPRITPRTIVAGCGSIAIGVAPKIGRANV